MAAMFAAGSATAAEPSYPQRPVRLICPFPPGGLTDILSRLVGGRLAEMWNQQVVVDNRTGGASVIGSEIVAKATPDGHTIGMLLSAHSVNPFVIRKLPYDTLKDFAPVTLVAIVPGIWTVRPGLPARTVKEVIALAKSKPGELRYASPGQITSGHLSMELVKLMAGIDVVHIPYKGGAPAVIDILGGRVDMMISSGGSVNPHIKAGRLVPIATSAARRTKALPNVPTIAEAGIPGYDTYEWYGVLTTGGTPREVVRKLQQDIVKVLQNPTVVERIEEQGAEPVGNTPEEFLAFIKDEMTKWGTLARKIGLKPE